MQQPGKVKILLSRTSFNYNEEGKLKNSIGKSDSFKAV